MLPAGISISRGPGRIKLFLVMHMNSFDTFIFPNTDVFKEEYYPLLLFCSPLHFLQPVEPDPDAKNDAEKAHFFKHGFWQAHTPAPLGNNRKSFLRLIDDIRANKGQYLEQLSALNTASGATPSSADDPEQKHAVVASLLKEHGVPEKDINGKLELWQSRLILTIAEILDYEEDDLQEELAYFNEDERATLRSLPREDDSDEGHQFKEVEKFTEQLKKPHLTTIAKRFDAWLHLMHQQPLPSVNLWLASTRAAAEQILQRYTSESGRHAVPLLKLVLPATISASGKYVVEQVEAFHRATALIHRGLAGDFTRITTTVPYVPDSPDSLLPYGTDWADRWENVLYDSFPATQNGRTDITFYLLPDQPVADFFAAPDTGKKVTNTDDGAAHGLLGVLGSACS